MLSRVSLPEAQAVSLVAYLLIFLCAPSVVTASTLVLLTKSTDVKLPTWSIAILAFASIPVYIAARIRYRSWSIERRAARLGAVLPSRMKGEKIGNVDIITKLAVINGFDKVDLVGMGLCKFVQPVAPKLERQG